MKMYRKCTNKPYFFTINTTLPADNPLRFRKKSFRFIIKMTLTDEIELLDDTIKENQAQYDLDREAAKTSALSSGELEKHKYLTGEDLGYKSGVVEKARSECFPLGKLLNKGLNESEKRRTFEKAKKC